MSEKFNTSGVNGRDCPVCYRTGTLAGDRSGAEPKLTCSGCLAVFAFTWSDGISPDTLTRIATPPRSITQRFPLRGLER